MKFLFFFTLVMLSACSVTPNKATGVQLGQLPGGLFFGLSFDKADAPHVVTTQGMFRWNGTIWEQLTQDGIQTQTEPRLAFDREGGALTTGVGNLYRRPPGSSTWEIMNADLKLYSLPIETSDGTYYAFGAGDPQSGIAPLYCKGAGDTAWTATGFSTSPDFPRLADTEGNLWTLKRTLTGTLTDGTLVRVKKTEIEEVPVTWASGVRPETVYLTAIRGPLLYGLVFGASPKVGQVFTFDLRARAVTALSEGSRCDPGSSGIACPPEAGSFISSVGVSPNNEVFEISGAQADTHGALLVLSGKTWFPLVDDLFPGTGIVFDSKGTLYLQENDSNVGAAVVRVDR